MKKAGRPVAARARNLTDTTGGEKFKLPAKEFSKHCSGAL